MEQPTDHSIPIPELAEWLAGSASADTVARLTQWAGEAPAHAALLRSLERVGDVVRSGTLAADPRHVMARQRVVANVLRRIDQNGSQSPPISMDVGPSRVPGLRHARGTARAHPIPGGLWHALGASRARWASAAAAALLVIGLALSARRVWTPASVAQHRTYATVAGQRATVELAGGTRATLGPSTRMTVTSRGDAGTLVAITGQAVFRVVHADRAPFTVRAGRAVARVLGTTFQVRHYADDRNTSVTVADGRVAVQAVDVRGALGAAHVLDAHMLGRVDDSGHVRVLAMGDTNTIGDLDGRVVFHDAPVRDVLAELSRTYGVTVTLADTSRIDHLLTWTVPDPNVPLTTAVAELATLLNTHAVRAGNVITLVPGRSTPRARTPYLDSLSFQRQYGQ